MTTTIVIPCFDEERRLDPRAFLDHLARSPGDRLLFVDDGSRDGTLRVLESMRRERPDAVDVLALPRNRGKAEAVRAGMRRALAGDGAYVGFLDADLATPLDAVADLRAPLEERPALLGAFGARVRMLGRRVVRLARRHYLGRVIATGISLSLGVPAYDTQCGAKLFRRGPHVEALFRDPFVTNWLFDTEILARAVRRHRDGLGPAVEDAFVEVPLRRWVHVEGSKVRARDFFKAWVEMRRIRRTYLA